MKTYVIISIACCLSAAILAAFALISTKKKNRQKGNLRSGENSRFATTLISLYAILSRYPLIRTLIYHIRKRLEFYTDFDERSVRKKTIIVFLITVFSFFALVLAFWLITKDALMLLIFTLILSFMTDTVVDVFVSNIYIKLMKQQLHYHELIRHKYYELKSVEDANYEACNELNKRGSFEIYTQAERINDILAAPDMETSLENYYETAPNKYLKLLAGMVYITREYGDTQKDGSSVFIKGIGYLSSEIRAEVFKREKLKFALRSLNIISLIPIFLVKPLREWAGTSFAPLENFYTSRTGIILGIVTVIVAFAAYMTLRRIQRFDKVNKPDLNKRSIEERIYKMGLYQVVDRLTPKGFTKKYKELEEIIKGSVSHINIQILFTRRVLVGVLAFILGIVLFIGLNMSAVNRILYQPEVPDGYLGGKLSGPEYTRLQDLTDLDRKIIQSVGRKPDSEKIKEVLMQNGIEDTASQQGALGRILDKISRLSDCYFKWYELLLCILLLGVGYYVPVMSLRFLKSVRRIDMEEEVAQFQTIILMLMHMSRIHVEEIMEWMEMFSVQFKEPIQKCLANFSSGSSEALECLKEDVAFAPFIGLIENLQLANEELGVQRAFEELENEMLYNQEKRKQLNEHIVESKKNLGNIIGFMPLYSLITLYLMIPMIVSGMGSISAFYKQISGF